MFKKLAAALAAAVVGVAWGATPALAAAPGNDTEAGATVIGALPFSEVIDTTEATTDATDEALNLQCGAPVTNGSVWYSFTAPAGVDGITVDVSASSFSAGAIIAQSDGIGGWYVAACGPGGTGTYVYEGGQYAILAFSDTAGVTGGSLSIAVEAATVPQVELTVSPKGKVDKYGNALINGTVTCTGGEFIDLYASLKQAVGRFAINGDGYVSGTCDGTTQAWTAVVTPYNGKFAGGKAASFTFAFTCGQIFCAESYREQMIKLSK